MDIHKLIRLGEGQHLEFKASFAEENAAINTLCAFANAEGGKVLMGVSDVGVIVGLSIGKNTLENFANNLRSNTEPPIYVSLTSHETGGRTVVIVSVKEPRRGELFYAFGRPFIRVGKTNQIISPQEQKERLLAGQTDWSEEKDRPRFDVEQSALTRTEIQFQPQWKVRQVAGDFIPTIEWRFRGARLEPSMEWRQASGAHLDRTTCSAVFDLSQSPSQDDLVPADQIGLEIRYRWRGLIRHELHRFSLTRADIATKALWDVGREILPPIYLDE